MRLYIKEAREIAGLSQKELARLLGVAPNTFNGYETGKHDPKSDLLKQIAHACGVSTDFLLGLEKQNSAPSLTDEALDVAEKYDKASLTIKNVVKAVLAVDAPDQAIPSVVPQLAEIIPMQAPPKRKIPIFNTAAGSGDPAPDIAWDYYETDNSRADFAIHIVGDSMEPLLPDGSVALGIRRMPYDGEIGAFRLDGQFLVKQVCQDIRGTTYLFSVNRGRADADQMIELDSGRDLWCFGTILCDRVPLPDRLGI